jgi:hypothetical protein
MLMAKKWKSGDIYRNDFWMRDSILHGLQMMVCEVLKNKVIIVLAWIFLFLPRCFRFAGVPSAIITNILLLLLGSRT